MFHLSRFVVQITFILFCLLLDWLIRIDTSSVSFPPLVNQRHKCLSESVRWSDEKLLVNCSCCVSDETKSFLISKYFSSEFKFTFDHFYENYWIVRMIPKLWLENFHHCHRSQATLLCSSCAWKFSLQKHPLFCGFETISRVLSVSWNDSSSANFAVLKDPMFPLRRRGVWTNNAQRLYLQRSIESVPLGVTSVLTSRGVLTNNYPSSEKDHFNVTRLHNVDYGSISKPLIRVSRQHRRIVCRVYSFNLI